MHELVVYTVYANWSVVKAFINIIFRRTMNVYQPKL